MGRRTPLRIFQSVLYHSSFAFLVFLTLVAVAGSAWGLISQAWNTGGQRRWNIVILVAGYGAVLFVSFFICLGRILNIRYTLQTIPRPYVPVKEADLPQSLSRYISGEYTRTAIIAHVQQPTAGTQEGWGAPGSNFPSLHYETFLLQKLHAINAILPPINHLINPTFPPTSASTIPFSPHKIRTLPLFYHPLLDPTVTEPLAKILDIAQYSGRELTEPELEKGIKILWAVQITIQQANAPKSPRPLQPPPPRQRSVSLSIPPSTHAPITFRPDTFSTPTMLESPSPTQSLSQSTRHPGRGTFESGASSRRQEMRSETSETPLIVPEHRGG